LVCSKFGEKRLSAQISALLPPPGRIGFEKRLVWRFYAAKEDCMIIEAPFLVITGNFSIISGVYQEKGRRKR
jgi:hypothetical protein